MFRKEHDIFAQFTTRTCTSTQKRASHTFREYAFHRADFSIECMRQCKA